MLFDPVLLCKAHKVYGIGAYGRVSELYVVINVMEIRKSELRTF